jgi:hypothetical protein
LKSNRANPLYFLGRLQRLSWQDRLLLLEAILWLAISGLAIALLPFRYVGFLAARPLRGTELAPEARLDTVKRVRWVIVSTAAWAPWRARCFQQGLAAQLMLRRRGIPAILYYGAVQDDKNGLHAHVWVRDGDVDIIGGEIADRFTTLATFPSTDPNLRENRVPQSKREPCVK